MIIQSKKSRLFFQLCGIAAMCYSCNSIDHVGGETSQIVLGDSSLIVTEYDSQYLTDFIQDIEWNKVDKNVSPIVDTPVSVPEPELKVPEQNSVVEANNTTQDFVIDLKDYKIVFKNIQLKELKKQNPLNQVDLSYLLEKGNIQSGIIHVQNVKNAEMNLRYVSKMYLKTNLGVIDLPGLGFYTSEFTKVKSKIKDASAELFWDIKDLKFLNVNQSKLKSTLSQQLKKNRINAKSTNEWQKTIRNFKNSGDTPSVIKLDNLQVQISGVTNNGKTIQKRIRVDIP